MKKVVGWIIKMGNVSDYFERIGYKPKYQIGDRVFGHYGKIPFVGTVGNDRCIDGKNPDVTILVDLPIKVDKEYKNVILVKHKDLKRLMSMDDEEPLKLPEAGSIPAKRTKG